MLHRKKTLSDRTRNKYPRMIAGTKSMEKHSTSFLEWTILSLFITAVCCVCDSAALFGMMDKALLQGGVLNWLVTITISVVENVLPLLIVYLWIKHKYQPEVYSAIPVWITFVALTLLFGILLYVRWMAIDFTFDMTVVEEEEYHARIMLNQAISLLLGILPILTSVGNGLVFYVSPTVYELRSKALRIRIIELKQQLAELDATVEVLEDREMLRERMLQIDKGRLDVAIAEAKAQLTNMRDYADLKLATHLGKPDPLSWINMKRKAV